MWSGRWHAGALTAAKPKEQHILESPVEVTELLHLRHERPILLELLGLLHQLPPSPLQLLLEVAHLLLLLLVVAQQLLVQSPGHNSVL